MFNKVILAFKDKDIRNRILFTLLIIFAFRIGSLITVPGARLTGNQFDSNSFFSLMNLLGGGSLERFSIFAIGITPYITGSIIIQLLSSDVIPILSKWKKQGESGRIKSERVTRYTALVIGVVQSIAITLAFSQSNYIQLAGFSNNPVINMIIITIMLSSGTMVAIWFSDQITIKGIGNGVSLIILSGILNSLPLTIINVFNTLINAGSPSYSILIGVISFLVYLIFFGLIILFLTQIGSSERKIPIQQTGQGLNLGEIKQQYIPFKVNIAGVVPVIFASAVLTLPVTIAQFLPENSAARHWMQTWLVLEHWFGILLFTFLTFFFSIFYSQIIIDPPSFSDNLKKQGTFILGIEPGKPTEKYIRKTTIRLGITSGIILSFLSAFPFFFSLLGVPNWILMSGTSILILVTVSLDLVREVNARLITKSLDRKVDLISNRPIRSKFKDFFKRDNKNIEEEKVTKEPENNNKKEDSLWGN